MDSTILIVLGLAALVVIAGAVVLFRQRGKASKAQLWPSETEAQRLFGASKASKPTAGHSPYDAPTVVSQSYRTQRVQPERMGNVDTDKDDSLDRTNRELPKRRQMRENFPELLERRAGGKPASDFDAPTNPIPAAPNPPRHLEDAPTERIPRRKKP
jgi:hypothetical protein